MAKKPSRKKIFKLVGESYHNEDGTPRQEILSQINPGVIVSLVREPDNKYDANAIVVKVNNQAIGYFTKEDALEIAPALDEGREHLAKLHKLSGGTPESPSYGAEVSISWDGEKEYPHKPLWNMQIYFREVTLPSKKRAKLAKRDNTGKFAGKSTNKSNNKKDETGCLPMIAIVLFIVPILIVRLVT